jgi:hypothetical protein
MSIATKSIYIIRSRWCYANANDEYFTITIEEHEQSFEEQLFNPECELYKLIEKIVRSQNRNSIDEKIHMFGIYKVELPVGTENLSLKEHDNQVVEVSIRMKLIYLFDSYNSPVPVK